MVRKKREYETHSVDSTVNLANRRKPYGKTDIVEFMMKSPRISAFHGIWD